jgi:hypothetical protein
VPDSRNIHDIPEVGYFKNGGLEKNHPLLTPTEKNWLESGQLLGRMQADRGFSIEKLPLTCRMKKNYCHPFKMVL